MAAATQALPHDDSKEQFSEKAEIAYLESATPTTEQTYADLEYTDDEHQPQLHTRTYLALFALLVLNYVQVVALNGPPSILSYIGKDLNGTAIQVWAPNSLSLVQAVGGPLIAFASDAFQARKPILIATCTIAFIGAAIAPGAKDMNRVIVAQTLIGCGFAAVPLAYCIPSEILPRKWRPLAQALLNLAAGAGSMSAPVIAGALTKRSAHTGWRYFYWFQMAMWGVTTLCLLFGYRPPPRHTELDHLSLKQKIGRLDLPGMFLLTGGLTLLLVGLTYGGNPYPWTSVRVLVPLILGFVVLAVFGIYEWKGTTTGILHHSLFQSRTFAVCIVLMFIEGICLFSTVIFYPVLTEALFASDPLTSATRQIPFWACGTVTVLYGLWSSKRRTIRAPLMVGFAIWAAGLAGLATIQPGQSANALAFFAISGAGFAAPLILLITGAQLVTPHHLIATATAVLTSARAIAASVFTAVYSAAVGAQAPVRIPSYTADAALKAGLAPQYVEPFVGGMLTANATILEGIAGLNPIIIAAGKAAILQASADSYRYVYIIAAPFAAAAVLISWFLGDVSKIMNYHVDAPVEVLKAREKHDKAEGTA